MAFCHTNVFLNSFNVVCYFSRFVAGVILGERIPAFERMLLRVCPGNVFLNDII